jgi:UDP:flavonoid glycosyltransferase YjiC (YdhE family)
LRVVLGTVGSLGDLHPYVAIARELNARGAQPVIASVPEYRADVEREAIEFAPARRRIHLARDGDATPALVV